MLSREGRLELLRSVEQYVARTGDPTPGEQALRRLLDQFGAMVNEAEAHKKPDRSALLRMAGNIAGGLTANPAIVPYKPTSYDADDIAEVAVNIAQAIMNRIDR